MGLLSDLDAVTIDAYGTLVTLVDPVPPLRAALAVRGVERSPGDVEAAFHAEADFYRERTHEKPLEELRRRCVAVFLEAAQATLDVEEFTPAFVDALRFEPLPGVVETIARLHAYGLALAWAGARPRAHAAIVSLSGLFLGVAVVQWALWQWVS